MIFFGQRLCVDCVFRQGGIVFCRKLYDVRPPLFDFLDIGGDVADTFISGGAQTRNHDKRYGEQKSHYDDGAQGQTDQSLQPRALPRRSLSHCASSGRRRVFIKKAIPPPSRNGKKQRSDSSDNADYTAEVHQRPRKQDKQRQRAKDIAKVASVEPECLRLCGGIALLRLMLALCFLLHFFFSVLPPAASLEKLNCLNHENHQHGQAQRDAVFGSAHRREAKGVGQERNLQNGGCEDKRTDHCRP